MTSELKQMLCCFLFRTLPIKPIDEYIGVLQENLLTRHLQYVFKDILISRGVDIVLEDFYCVPKEAFYLSGRAANGYDLNSKRDAIQNNDFVYHMLLSKEEQ